MTQAVRVTTACRLHFGLMSVGEVSGRAFGGVGLMVQPPNVKIAITPAQRFFASGNGADRIREFAERWQKFYGRNELPACRITVESLPRMHAGLGVGTQLGLAVAKGLNAFHQLSEPSLAELAQSVGRGLRSAVGSHGFNHGGLIFELGKAPGDVLGPLEKRISLPESWRFVLICQRFNIGLYGSGEVQAFMNLPAVPPEVSEQLRAEAVEHLLPAAEEGDFERFSASVYRFGYQSGMSFAAVQGGAYNGPRLTQLVERIRSLGIEGVGQSSWGPTIFAVCRNERSAEMLASSLASELSPRETDTWISAPCNRGARVDVI